MSEAVSSVTGWNHGSVETHWATDAPYESTSAAVGFARSMGLPTRASHFIGFSRKGCRGEPSSTVNRKFSGVGTRTVTRRELVRPCASSPWA